MRESLALAGTVIAVDAVAAFAAHAYQREKYRRFQILRELTGTTVILGIARGGQGRWTAHVRARIVEVPGEWHHPDHVTVDILNFETRKGALTLMTVRRADRRHLPSGTGRAGPSPARVPFTRRSTASGEAFPS
jgi:hypothetical protein